MAELQIHVRDWVGATRPKDGDIELALNDRYIKANWLAKLTHPWKMERDRDGQMKPGNICQCYCDHVYEYKFEFLAPDKMRRTNQWTGEITEYDDGIPHPVTGEVWNAAPRLGRLRASTSKAHFGPVEQDVWYGGGMRQEHSHLDLVWDEVEGLSDHRRERYKRFNFGDGDKRDYLLLEADDFTDRRSQELTQPVVSIVGEEEVVTQHRMNKVIWRSVRGVKTEDILDRSKIVDMRDEPVIVDPATLVGKDQVVV